MQRLVSILVFICLTSFAFHPCRGATAQGTKVHTIVIDPGHGGMDPGAIGPGGHHESDLALGVSLKFGDMIKKAFPDVKIIYTRTTDKFVSLADRADMANKAKADLFICIHLNAATNHEAYGTATYVLGLHRTDDNLEIAKRENAVIELEGDKDKNYEFDPNSPEGHIIMSMKQNAFLDQSILIASKIEDELAMLSKRKSHGVKQAGFWVLYKTAMPSLLAEIGFVSNPSEEQYLATDAGQANVATSLYKAFRAYKFEIEGVKDTAQPVAQAVEKKSEKFTPDAQPTAQNTKPANVNPPKAPDAPKAATPTEKQPPISLNNQEAGKEEKIWQPDTNAVMTPVKAAPVAVSTQTDFKPIDQVAKQIIDTPVGNAQPTVPNTSSKKLISLKDEKPAARTARVTTIKDDITATGQIADAAVDTAYKEPVPASKPMTKPLRTASATKIDTLASVPAKPATTKPRFVADKESVIVPKGEAAAKPIAVAPTLIAPAPVKVTPAPKPAPIAAIPAPGTPAPVATKPATTKPKFVADKESVIAPKGGATTTPTLIETTHTATKDTTKRRSSALIISPGDDVYFTVQLQATKRKPANYDDLVNTFGVINREDITDGMVRYMAGEFSRYSEAKNALQVAHDKGIKDAFIVGYLNKIRLDGRGTVQLGQKFP